MGKTLKTVGVIIGGAALIATGVGALAMPALAGTTTLFGVSVGTLNTISSGLVAVGGMLDKPKSQGSASPDEWTSNPDQPIPFLMGRMGVAGKIVQRDEFGPDNMYQGIVGIISGAGPIRGVNGFAGDKQPVTFGANGIAVTSQWQGEMWMVRRAGNQPDTALAVPAGLKSGGAAFEWSAAARLSGKACYLQVLGENSKGTAYPAGIPDPVHDAEGIFGYDPRYDDTYPGGAGPCRLGVRSTYRWINDGGIGALNWALGLVENGQVVGGIGASIDGIDVPAFVEVANIADANGWTLSAWPDTSEDASAVLDQLLQAAGAVRARHAGKISCVSRGAPRASVATITARDTAGDIELDTAPSLFNRLNTITPRFMSEAAGWVMTPANPVSFPQYVTDDGGKHGDQIDYRFVSNLKQAAELAAYDILDAREPFSGTIPLKAHMRHLKRGDTFDIDEPGFLMDGVKCIVLSRSYDPKTAQVRLGFRSETDSKHPLALGKTTTLPAFPVLTPTDPTFVTPPLPGDWVITPRPPSQGGTQQPGFDLTGFVSNSTATAIIVETGPSATGPWKQAYQGPPTVTNIPIDGLQPGATYFIAIQYQRNQNYSEREVFGPFTAPDLIAGDVSPTAPTIVAMQDAIDLASEGIGSIDTAIASLNATIYTAGTGLKARSDAMFADINTASTGLKAQTASLLASLNTPTTGVLARLTATEGQVATNNTAAVNRLNALEATVNTAGTGLTARLATAESAIVTNRDAAAQRLSALEATVDGAGTGLSAKVSGLQSAVSDLVSGKADATDLVNLTARVFGAESVNIAQDQRLTTVEVDVAGKASAVRVAALETSIDTPSTGLKARLAVQEAATSDLVANKADATRVAALEATVNTAGTGLSARVAGLQSAVSNLAQGKADAVDLVNLTARVFDAEGVNTAQNNRLNTVEVDIAGKASATRVEALEAAVNTPGTGLAARITTAEQAIATETTARAEAVSQLLARQNINRNLLPGGSGERGVVGWDAPAGLTVVDSPANGGSVFYKDYTSAGAVDHLHISPKVAIGEATHITLSFKGGSLGFSGGVRLGYLGFYNDAGNYIGESATRPMTGGEVTAAKPSGATKVAFVAKVSGTASSSYAEVFFRQIKIEPGQVATIYSNDALDQYLSSSVGELRQATIDLAAGKADASRVTTLEASVNTPGTGISARLTNVESVAASADGRAKAIKGVVLDVNGYVSGYSSTNDGLSAAFEVSADKFAIRAPGSGERTEYRAGNWHVYSPSENTRTRYGKAFGGDQKLVWWTGPTSVAEGSETKGNAYVYMSQNTVGGPRFGGSDVLGPGGTLTATASTGFIGGARNGAGYVNTSNQVTVTVSGGTSGATIRWTRISGDSRIQMNNATAFTTGAYATIGAGEVISAYFMGSITKGGQSAVVYVQVDLSDNGT